MRCCLSNEWYGREKSQRYGVKAARQVSMTPAHIANDRKEVMMSCHRKRMFLLFMLFACVSLLAVQTASARDLVSGRYISSAGKNIILDLDIKGPST
ncbi:MAG: hypothetical protein MUO63_13875, partial [Desulfobulbaceae bacterium]|nr:hypothetical protein [Desulfobulbaceae bacterium]